MASEAGMVTAIILTSPNPQVWHLLGLPAPGEPGAPAAAESRAPDSGDLDGSGNASSFGAFLQRETSSSRAFLQRENLGKCADFLL